MVKVIQINPIFILVAAGLLTLAGCGGTPDQSQIITATLTTPLKLPLPTETNPIEEARKETESPRATEVDDGVFQESEDNLYADVISVTAAGHSNQYQFSVGISSPDTGCEQFADWWEVLSEDGKLIYRRILLHSHVSEQPFTRSGGPINIKEDTIVYIRAHMNQVGYGGVIMKGSVNSGFIRVDLPPEFSPAIENESPLPTGCNF